MGIRDEWNSYELYDGESVLSKTFSVNLGQDQTITERVCPLLVKVDETSNWYPTGTPSQVNSDLYAAWFIVNVGLEPTGSTTILRLESNTKGITLNSFFDCLCSGVPAGNMDFWFKGNPATGVDAWSVGGGCSTDGGMLKVKIGNAERYIALFQTHTP